jgi:formate-dependent nitrite reductase membrane component NrfD
MQIRPRVVVWFTLALGVLGVVLGEVITFVSMARWVTDVPISWLVWAIVVQVGLTIVFLSLLWLPRRGTAADQDAGA